MVQPPGPARSAPSRFRERHREARRREFLDTARRIVTEEGLQSLTMQRITSDLGTSTGGIYIYFPTKDALLTELQVEAVTTLGDSYVRGQRALADRLAGRRLQRPTVALTHVVASGRFWVEAERSMPIDVELFRRLFANAPTTAPRDAARRAPIRASALAALQPGRERLDTAVDAKVLHPGDGLERFIELIAGVTGALLMSRVEAQGADLFDGPGIARALIRDLVVAWGATRSRVAAAEALLDELSGTIELAPPRAI